MKFCCVPADTRGVRNQPRRLWLLIALGLLVAACSGGAGDSTTTVEESTTSTAEEATTSSAPSTTTTSSTSSTTTTIAPTTSTTTELGTPEDPLPVGDELMSGFTYTTTSTEWEGTVAGLVETDLGEFNDEPGRCLVALGTLTPTSIEDGSVTNSFSTPDLSLIVGGRLLDNDVNECDTSDIESAGYGWILDAEVTAGTTYPFYAEFFLAEGSSDPETMVLGSATGDNALYYEPTVLDSIPGSQSSSVGTSDQDLIPLGDQSQSGFTYTTTSTEWEGHMSALVEVDTGQFNEDPGRCLTVLGTLTPTSIEDGTVTNSFDTPDISLVVNGRLVRSDTFECDDEGIEAAGYGWILDAEVTVDTSYDFYTTFFLAGENPAEPESVVVGSASSGDALYYEPTVSEAIP